MRAQANPSSAASATAVDAIELLTTDHRAVDALFKEFENAPGREQKVALAQRICDELTVHATIEEELFYPLALDALEDEDSDLVWEASVEHGTLEGLIDIIRKQRGDEEQFDAHVTVLKEYVQHHVKEEETSMFPKVRASELDLEAVGAMLEARKIELMEQMSGRDSGKKSMRGTRRPPASKRGGSGSRGAKARTGRKRAAKRA